MGLTLRLVKGSILTWGELDDNFKYLQALALAGTGSTGGTGSITGTPSQVLYFDSFGNVTGDDFFTRTGFSSSNVLQLSDGSTGLVMGMTAYDPIGSNLGASHSVLFHHGNSGKDAEIVLGDISSDNGPTSVVAIVNIDSVTQEVSQIIVSNEAGGVSIDASDSFGSNGNLSIGTFSSSIVSSNVSDLASFKVEIDQSNQQPKAYWSINSNRFELPSFDGAPGDSIITNGFGILTFSSVGTQGPQGSQGPAGTFGPQGSTGPQGPAGSGTFSGGTGINGTNVLTWNRDMAFTNGVYNINGTTFQNTTQVGIHKVNNNGADVSTWLEALSLPANNGLTGSILMITQEDDHSVFGIYNVISATFIDPIYNFGVVAITATGSITTTGSSAGISWQLQGPVGPQGATFFGGPQGFQGPTGPTGETGPSGATGTPNTMAYFDAVGNIGSIFNVDDANFNLGIGLGNTIGGQSSFAMGSANQVNGFGSVVGGNFGNNVQSNGSFVFGYNNYSNSNNSAILGASGSVISGGSFQSSIIGGHDNSVNQSYRSVVVGGYYNNITTSTENSGIILGICNNMTSSKRSVLIGGSGNQLVNSNSSTSLGGFYNLVSYSNNSSIIGGYCNCIFSNSISSIVGGGSYNIMQNSLSSNIIGGSVNILYNSYCSSIISGRYNSLGVSCNSIIDAGRGSNIYQSNASGIFAGGYNTICYNSVYSAIIGGEQNVISNVRHSVILGGSSMTLDVNDTVLVPSLRINIVPEFADNAAAVTGGLTASDVYKTTTGGSAFLKIVF